MKASKTNVCAGCPAFAADGRCIGRGATDRPGMNNVIFLGGAPKPDIAAEDYLTFKDRVGEFFSGILNQIRKENGGVYKDVSAYYLYSIQCVVEKEDADIIRHCTPIVHQQMANAACNIVIPMGVTALRSLGVSMSITEARGKDFNVTLGGRNYRVFPTFNPGALMRKENVGKVKLFKDDIKRALDASIRRHEDQPTVAEMTKNYRFAKTVAEAREIINDVLAYQDETGKKPYIAVDTETTGLETWLPDFRMIAMSFAWGPGKAAAILLNHKHATEDWTALKPDLERLLGGENKKVFHNFKFDYKVITLSQGFEIRHVGWDTMIGEFLIDENKKGFYGLKDIVRTRVPAFVDYEKAIHEQMARESPKARLKKLNEEKARISGLLKTASAERKQADDKETKGGIAARILELKAEKEEVAGKIRGLKDVISVEKASKKSDADFEAIDIDDMLLYAAIDADCTWRITAQQLKETTDEDPDLRYAMASTFLPTAITLGQMEHEGFRIDMEYLAYLEAEFQKIMDEEEQKVYQAAGKVFNINSGKQLQDVLIVDCGIKLTKKTGKSQQFSLDEDVISKLAKEHPICSHILRYRKAAKGKNTFLAGIRDKSAGDGRVHANYNQTQAATARLSSSGPNMQNLPKKILGYNIKKLFIPDDPENEYFCEMDYSGAEVRILTAYAPDETLINNLNMGMNMHSFVANEIFSIPYEEFQTRAKYKATDPKKYEDLDSKRQISKKTVFLTIYGGSAETLYENLTEEGVDITLEQCQKIISTFLERFPIIRVYMDQVKNQVNRHGYVKTFFGNRRRFPAAKLDWSMRNAAYREAINAPIQGTSALLVVSQLNEMARNGGHIGFKPRVTVHDSIGFCFRKDAVDKVRPFLDKYAEARVTEKFPWMPVPFAYEAAYGGNYGECKNVIRD